MRSYAQAIPTMDYVENGVFYSMPIVLPDGSWGHYKQESDGDINKGADNLVAAAKTRTDQISKWDRLVASAFLQLDIAKGLTFKTIGSYNYFTKGYDGYTPYNPRTFGSKDRKDSYSINQQHLIEDEDADRFEFTYDMKQLYRVIHSIPEEMKVPFQMFVAGFKYREIAEKLGLPMGTVKSRLFFIRKRLKEELKDFSS